MSVVEFSVKHGVLAIWCGQTGSALGYMFVGHGHFIQVLRLRFLSTSQRVGGDGRMALHVLVHLTIMTANQCNSSGVSRKFYSFKFHDTSTFTVGVNAVPVVFPFEAYSPTQQHALMPLILSFASPVPVWSSGRMEAEWIVTRSPKLFFFPKTRQRTVITLTSLRGPVSSPKQGNLTWRQKVEVFLTDSGRVDTIRQTNRGRYGCCRVTKIGLEAKGGSLRTRCLRKWTPESLDLIVVL